MNGCKYLMEVKRRILDFVNSKTESQLLDGTMSPVEWLENVVFIYNADFLFGYVSGRFFLSPAVEGKFSSEEFQLGMIDRKMLRPITELFIMMGGYLNYLDTKNDNNKIID